MKKVLIIALSIVFAFGFSKTAERKGFKENNKDIWNTVLEVPTLSGELNPDGVMDEELWSSSSSLNVFYNGREAKQLKTKEKVRVFFDGENIVFGIEAPAMKTKADLSKCYLSDEWDLRRAPNISIY